MNVRSTLAANLSLLCAGEESIAAVCRGTGINRQQFNRYLSADALPNDRNLEKICRYFGIDQSDLFQDRSADAHVPAEHRRAPLQQPDVRAAFSFLETERAASMPPGPYVQVV